ncbi:M20 family metallopeptidase [Staphylococcus nepalensis]|uniref:Probable succinyl-diaminopimelate desuccinylase n=1 Tax=Staphylococcus nepalensis TaxID=214473 RepID=A0A2T4S8W0_9STAP|nr:M20 family metallopeptidase [Staphylococcus nepalensis]VDG68269.1 acetylornithine deacetylase/succinyl-diaminopimelate desuccinylase [Lacrimispora indolis]PNZ96949.1 acetylornithine deacetylase [Staphylococcus nepalensis]PTK58231.1 acetylornithine deacetylase [Staphylococcus nepalensis]SUM56293.1 succinyl-diaminopimelate desuccinylase [Staphylococcus nepalensis]GGB82745.1 succinyl-diaminopimelate desuccinylase [Staphylococcus nepalensis]
MTQSNLDFLKSLINIDSTNPPANEDNVVQVFKKRCESKNIPFDITNLSDQRSNISVTLKSNQRDAGKLLLSGHTDTVKIGAQEWKYDPFKGEIEDGKLYGRGTSDMKSGLAALYLALESVYEEGYELNKDIEFLATAGEEVDSIGAKHYVQSTTMDNIDAIIIAEPTSEKVAIGHKGALWIEVTLTGKTAHGAMPEQGINAVEGMNKVINLVNDLKEEWAEETAALGKSSISANMINGGIQTNVIPDQCVLNVDIRTVTPNIHDNLYNQFNQRLNQLFSDNTSPKVSTQVLLDRATVLTNENAEIIQNALDISNENNITGMAYYTDGSVLNPDSNIPTLIYGPGIETLAHQPNEYVEAKAFERSIDFFKNLIKQFAK